MPARPEAAAPLLPVEQALARILAAMPLLPAEDVAVSQARGRVTASPVRARRTQPPLAVSAMDGYAARAADVATVPAMLRQIGAVPAGAVFEGRVGPGETVRIFTGAPVPAGADTVIIQEDVEAESEETGARVRVRVGAPAGTYIRPAGLDFREGETGIAAGRRLTARDIGLAAAMNQPWLSVRRRPRIAILATGDEIVRPGDPLGPAQIVSSNAYGLGALIEAAGGIAINLGIAPDDAEGLRAMAAGARGADMLVTTGGASVGRHDLVRQALGEDGLEVDFWRIAMRPGKPLIFGHIGGTPLLGLPGNPVSTMVCATIFLEPAMRAMAGLPSAPQAGATARLGAGLAANDRRQDYLRARLTPAADGGVEAVAFPVQDSSMLSRLAAADCLIVRPPHDPPRRRGETVPIIRLDGEPAGG